LHKWLSKPWQVRSLALNRPRYCGRTCTAAGYAAIMLSPSMHPLAFQTTRLSLPCEPAVAERPPSVLAGSMKLSSPRSMGCAHRISAGMRHSHETACRITRAFLCQRAITCLPSREDCSSRLRASGVSGPRWVTTHRSILDETSRVRFGQPTTRKQTGTFGPASVTNAAPGLRSEGANRRVRCSSRRD